MATHGVECWLKSAKKSRGQKQCHGYNGQLIASRFQHGSARPTFWDAEHAGEQRATDQGGFVCPHLTDDWEGGTTNDHTLARQQVSVITRNLKTFDFLARNRKPGQREHNLEPKTGGSNGRGTTLSLRGTCLVWLGSTWGLQAIQKP